MASGACQAHPVQTKPLGQMLSVLCPPADHQPQEDFPLSYQWSAQQADPQMVIDDHGASTQRWLWLMSQSCALLAGTSWAVQGYFSALSTPSYLIGHHLGHVFASQPGHS